MFYSNKLKKLKKIKHCFFSRKNGFSKGIYKGLNCGKGSRDNKININAGKAADAKNASDAYDQILVGRLVKFNGESTKVNGNSFMDSRNINSEPARILGISKGIVTLKKVFQ